MNHGPRRLPRIPSLSSTGPPIDADLLARFISTGDEVAFELLVRRHAPMVLAVCRRVLADPNDADDAFQAAFLVLARKAASVARAEVLAGWLYRIAYRAAVRVRSDRLRRATHADASPDLLPAPTTDPNARELERVLDEEVAKLPERHRVAFVLCCLEGKTGEEAGRLIGCPPGTVSSRLTRARERLRERLTRRGFAPALIVTVLSACAESAAAVSALTALIDSTVHAAPGFATRRPTAALTARPATIAEGVIRTMNATKLKTLALLFALGLLAVGGVFAAPNASPEEEPNQPPKAKVGGAQKAPAAPVVRVVQPQRGGLDRVSRNAGHAEPLQQADLFATIAGTLKRVNVNLGDHVKRGQLLAEIDAPALVLEERRAQIDIEQAKSLLHEAEARLIAAKAEINTAKLTVKQRETEEAGAKATHVLWRKKHDQIVKISGAGTSDASDAELHLRTAETQLEGATVAIESAKSDVAVKQSKLLQTEANVGNAKTTIEAANLALQKARLALEQAKIEAPFDGVVTRQNASAGDHVRPTERDTDRALFTLTRVDRVRFVTAVPESEVAHATVGASAVVTFASRPGVRINEKISRIGFAIEKNGRMRVEVDVPAATNDIRPGMFGEVTLTLGKGPADALRVPLSAITEGPKERPGGSHGVYVYRDGKARLTFVKVSQHNEKEVEIASGLTADDLVVVDPKGLKSQPEVAVEVERPAPPK
ncbi:sigma-70 family rna polymerase sigma factor : RNA polymerase sigma factor, sigma-70 family OS=Singulisphaera acidiphila (strain ATCC BAA-1392 / DSM 18658 / VKM B-2454 / MOB10) GN=Sinac_6419 PE=4 SV=1: Sigma70_r2: Sigma70_r4_2: HlyD_2 [Gemmata massiliana]|uniref:RND efflux pump membrane fusion protein barrel-sandwich domain-containing protein n=1 Tax=Gemmata massiliana TaxID=1210884 RepID=A0A6P2D3X2_9BACT|nr:efflux RND transporter periplasmic adaptor subunit [Gemmata massiliana]VTR94804.1 sigma-70 family rna polymerase sigma factor : RNA polymerase sigma factor, sigma-70 family OS=Singulisphaera acidiphila (strain ATCC BAA-1392 / DSM 18658 / VKM B-2454 / MOB10) GN=Sinac_6419 PE=4 SV=1: Sigma70_r2: Sigma70_r4_2: HlyD_2 [Gemmata massiliana]